MIETIWLDLWWLGWGAGVTAARTQHQGCQSYQWSDWRPHQTRVKRQREDSSGDDENSQQ